jgi:hypothetical protein
MIFTRPGIRQKLEEVFNPRQATVLAEVVEAAYSDLVKTGDFNELKAIVRDLAQAQTRTELCVEELAEAQKRTEQELRALAGVVGEMQTTQATMQNTQSAMKGMLLETRYRERAGSYLGGVLRRVKAFLPAELEEELAPHLSEADYQDWLQVDLAACGRPKDHPEAEVWLAVEVSAVVDCGDVERAARRAGHLRSAGYVAVPAAAGEQATEGAASLAEEMGVALFLPGQAAGWAPALERALNLAR